MNESAPNSTILISDGLYEEKVTINKSIRIIGSNATIKTPTKNSNTITIKGEPDIKLFNLSIRALQGGSSIKIQSHDIQLTLGGVTLTDSVFSDPQPKSFNLSIFNSLIKEGIYLSGRKEGSVSAVNSRISDGISIIGSLNSTVTIEDSTTNISLYRGKNSRIKVSNSSIGNIYSQTYSTQLQV
ncbi:MAG: hypothetical protein ABEI86_05125, partial [Halobacteriaceae archaeon]